MLNIVNGGPPPPPPSAGASRLALRDGSPYSPTPASGSIFNPDVPIEPPGPDAPLAIRDVRPVKKPQLKPKPKIKVDPPVVPKKPIIILDPPPRKKPRREDGKAGEILRILDDMTDSEPRRAKRTIAAIPVPTRNRLRIVPAVGN